MRRHGRLNTCAGCLPKVTGVQRLLTVLAARQKLPPETAAEGKLLTDGNLLTYLQRCHGYSGKQMEVADWWSGDFWIVRIWLESC